MEFEFIGSDLTADECDLMALTTIHHTHLQAEAQASQNKWFDYRLWPHIKATYYFGHCYIAAYRRFFEQTRDRETAKIVPVFRTQDVLDTRERTNLHLARQAFDLIGVRYDFGMSFAMRRFGERGWRSMPRVNQLYGEEILADMQDAWKIECRAKLQIPKHDHFKAENYVGSLTQIQFHDWLESQINMRSHRYMALGQVVYRDKVMPEDVALSRYGAELVARAKRDAI